MCVVYVYRKYFPNVVILWSTFIFQNKRLDYDLFFLPFYLKEKCVVLKIFKFLCFSWNYWLYYKLEVLSNIFTPTVKTGKWKKAEIFNSYWNQAIVFA